MPEKILIVGGVALGPKAASRCKRLMPDAEVTLVDENVYISYGGCGIPYYVSGEVQNLDDLRATPYHTIRDPEFFRAMKGVTVRNQTRALSIDRAAKTLLVKDVISGKEEELPYDKLVLATGASPRVPPVEGKDLKNVLSLTRLEAADAIRTACQEGKVNEAVIVGGGFIGLE
ncbi:MAG: FAD/NAD(P)-binding oxidoreductase, partial [Desulfovibrio fairfieldensis]